MTRLIRPLRSGQITIPISFRRKLGISETSMLQMTLVEGELHVKPVQISHQVERKDWLKDLYTQFAPVRDETRKFSDKKLNDAIDTAITAVRKTHA